MSRSRKKTPVFNIAGSTRKQDRKLANRVFRRKEKQIIAHIDELEEPIFFEKVSEVSDVWGWACDGWRYWPKATEKDLRK